MTTSSFTGFYTLSVGLLIGCWMRALVTASVFSIQATQRAYNWREGVGVGAVLAFSAVYTATAIVVQKYPRMSPVTCLRLGAYVFVVFAILILVPIDATIFVVSFALLGFTAMSQSVLLDWWGKMQLDKTSVVVARLSMASVLANVPLSIYGALLNSQSTIDFRVTFAITGLLVGCFAAFILQRFVYRPCLREDTVDSTVTVCEYQDNPLATRNVYDMECDVFINVPLPERKSVELSDLKLSKAEPVPPPVISPPTIDVEDRKQLESLDLDSTDLDEVATSTTATTAETVTAKTPVYPINRPTFAKPRELHAKSLHLWLGSWTFVITFTNESLLNYNIAGFSAHYDTPWYVIVVVIILYTTMIATALFLFTRVGDSTRVIRYVRWYRIACYSLLLAAFVHSILMMTEHARKYEWHSALSIVYMMPLTVVATMPLSRAQEMCQRYNYSLHALLAQWTVSAATASAAAYAVEYFVLLYNRQLPMMFFLAALNIVMYFRLRRDEHVALQL